MTKRSPWFSLIEEGSLCFPRRHILKSTEDPRPILTIALGSPCSPNRGSLSQCHGMDDTQPAYLLRFTPDGTSPNEHQGVRRGATLPHYPMTTFQMESSDGNPTAAPRPCLYAHRHACLKYHHNSSRHLRHNLTPFLFANALGSGRAQEQRLT